MIYYWLVVPAVLYTITGSFSFVLLIYFEPAICMMYFLAFINIGLHAYIEYDENQKQLYVRNHFSI